MDKKLFLQFQDEINSRMHTLLSQYLRSFEIQINLTQDYVITVELNFDESELADADALELMHHIHKLIKDYDPYAMIYKTAAGYVSDIYM